MNLEMLRRALLWCTVINYGILLVWFLVFASAHEWIYGLHGRWFHLTPEQFDAIHYGAMAIYKVGVLLLNLTPLVALYIVGRSGRRP